VRAFVALDLGLPEPLAELLERRPEHFHLTLRFLDELPETAATGVLDAMGEAAGSAAPFELELRGLGGFPNARDPRVLWVGLGDGAASVLALVDGLEAGLGRRGFPLEPRPFCPHATLRRLHRPAERNAAASRILEVGDRSFGRQRVEELVLYESRLDGPRAIHRPRGVVRLGVGGPDAVSRR
jgi:2'-5' RNA ligase